MITVVILAFLTFICFCQLILLVKQLVCVIFRCCFPWQILDNDKCVMSKTTEKTNLVLNLVTSMPDCDSTVVGKDKFKLEEGRAEIKGGKIVQKGGYCIDRETIRVCKDKQNFR